MNNPQKWSLTFATALCVSGLTQADRRFDIQLESKAHYRSSEQNRFPVNFPFPTDVLPEGETRAALETVDEGDHFELSTINLSGKWQISDKLSANLKIDFIDRYDRNPTSSDNEVDLDRAIFRYGNRYAPLRLPSNNDFYAQIGKFGKFERQGARRTESYGLVSTAFNRLEDSGIEFGFDLASGFYGKLSWTTGNPVFIRDPNALAGDNGRDDEPITPENRNPELKTGIVILYDAEVEDFDLGSDSEQGLGLGYRWQAPEPSHALDILAFAYQRNLADERDINGSFYGADLDLFDLSEVVGAEEEIALPFSGNDKNEYGVNIWYNNNQFALFGQYVFQDLAGLERDGYELELSYVVDWIVDFVPIIRYSQLDNHFTGDGRFPAPSVWWDWEENRCWCEYSVKSATPAYC